MKVLLSLLFWMKVLSIDGGAVLDMMGEVESTSQNVSRNRVTMKGGWGRYWMEYQRRKREGQKVSPERRTQEEKMASNDHPVAHPAGELDDLRNQHDPVVQNPRMVAPCWSKWMIVNMRTRV